MMRLVRCAVASLLGFTLILSEVPSALAVEPVDLMLVLASDVSRSVDHPKFCCNATVTRPRSPIRRSSIPSSPARTKDRDLLCRMVRLRRQKVVIDWTAVDGAASARSSAT